MAGALIVQNSPAEGPGLLSGLLAADGISAEVILAPRQALPAPARHGLLVLLGAPESANDGLPYLRREEELVREFASSGRPVLGICLGAQLVARALGGRVYRGPREEVGFARDLRPCGGPGSALAGLGSPFAALHMHRDTFDLPPGAARLAESDTYPNQAFSCGSAVGLQFHLEADEASARRWLGGGGEGIGAWARETGANMGRFYAGFMGPAGMRA